ncbi:MAG: cellulase family glycosylhydrolase [Rariglobus sp.]
MNNQKQTHTPPRRTHLRSFVSLFTLSLGLASSAHAATYYQTVNQSGAGSWNDLPAWNTAADGTGTAPAAINATDDFVCNKASWVLRTPATSFGGKSLTLGPASHSLLVKSGTTNITIPSLFTSGAAAIKSGSTNSTLTITSCLNSSGTTLIANHSATNALFPLTIGTLTGSGNFNLTGSVTGVMRLTLTDATDYLGTITLTSGKLELMNALSSAGSFVVITPGDVTTNQTVTFTGLTVAGVVKNPGTYTAASLGFLGTGSVIVRPAATWYLTTNQAGSQNWTEAYVANWNSLANGLGVAPTSLNPFDNYVNQGSGRELRTPTTGSTFGGGSLTLSGTAKLTMKSPAGTVSTIPAFITSGTPSIANGYGNVREDLSVGDWEIVSGSTKLSASAGRSLGFAIDYLTGSGGLQTQSGGAFYLSLNHGSGYTGTLDHASGSLRFENAFSSRGAFNVGSSATVTLDQPVYFTSLTVAGVAQPAGIQTYATLNAAYPAQFPAGSPAGLVGVYTPGAAPVPIRGVNISGPESDTANLPGTYGYNYVYPTVADFDYYHAKGLNLIRIPFRWERMQHGLNVPLDTAQLGYMDTAIARASARGMKVIIDMHNYAECKVSGVKYRFGSAGLPASAYADVWRRLADHYKNEPAIYGYDIMNEPNGLAAGVWVTYAQAAISAIREVDLNHDIIVEGESWANAWGFETKNPNLHTLRDPLDRIIFSAHSYWSDAGTDVYKTYDLENGANPQMGVENVKPFVDWLKKYDFKGYVGEYGVPNDDPRWNVVLENFLDYLDAEGISGTYWAGGAWYGGSAISCHPSSNYTVDRAVMSVLQTHP